MGRGRGRGGGGRAGAAVAEGRAIPEDQFILERAGVRPTGIAFSRATAQMSGVALRRAQATLARDLGVWQDRVDKARAEYQRLTGAGEVRPPTRMEGLIERARGHPDNESTQAARRVLARRGVEW